MRQVEFHRYWVRSPGLDTPSLTDFVMDAETAAREYPGATPEASSRVVWEEPETEEERIEWMAHHPVTMPPSASAAMHHVPAAQPVLVRHDEPPRRRQDRHIGPVRAGAR